MTNQQPNPKIIQAYQFKNKEEYYQHIKQNLSLPFEDSDNQGLTLQQLQKKMLEPYQKATRNFYYIDTIFSAQRSKEFFESALKQVHPQIKYSNSKNTKNLLRSICKVFLQELAENAVQVMTQMKKGNQDQQSKNNQKKHIDNNKKKQITMDVEVINQAFRKMNKNVEKEAIFKNVFK